MICHCSHPLDLHRSGVVSERTQDGSRETPVLVCQVCRCVLQEWPELVQREMFMPAIPTLARPAEG